MNKQILLALAALGFAGFSACSDDAADREAVFITKEQSMVMPGSYFQFTLHNDSFREISLPNCCYQLVVFVERWNGTAWMTSFAMGDPCYARCAWRPIYIPHTSGIQDSIAIDTVGQYRLRMPYAQPVDGLPEHSAFSQTFFIDYLPD
jgi:hypothetical protein